MQCSSARRESSFIPQRILIVSKVSQLQFERLREPDLDEVQFKSRLIRRGSDYDTMLANHEKNKAVEIQLIDTLKNINIDYKITNRLTIDQSQFDWADLVIAVGGDGTFLLAANLIFDNKKPIIGINSDPDSSEGHLMLQRRYTNDVKGIFERLRDGHYEYVMRTRIRVTVQGESICQPPFHMHDKSRIAGLEMYQFLSNALESKEINNQKKLPWLALNEVFIGESLSAKTSSLELRVNDEPNYHKLKCSGICVSTGTGSSSWYKAINSVTPHLIKRVLDVSIPKNKFSEQEIERICDDCNKNIQFSPDDGKMSYVIRDIILNDIWKLPKTLKTRAYCNKLTIRSHCYDGGLVFDGGVGVPFNIGTIATLETSDTDALRTIKLPD
ncbi:NAD kinase 2, mitochondrial isoform X2 [Chelonus insularis]|nr:NAD kinase 2, mitochondrial isoform X2 [Chelonus insularis]